ncbi:GatB/YqeY domain-containing protein [Pelagibacteraceae bacterium]|nr:GatB/YqeY domain-containing protein [Pelagibacteraceae bacterium]
MSLQTQIEEKLNQSLKNKDKSLYPTLRLIVSGIKDVLIANRTKEIKEVSDQDIIGILKKMVKQRNESCEVYKKAGRTELLEIEKKEIEIINSFLPKQLNEEDTKKLCEEVIKKVGASSIKDMGKVMGELKKTHGDFLDFSKVGSIIKTILK